MTASPLNALSDAFATGKLGIYRSTYTSAGRFSQVYRSQLRVVNIHDTRRLVKASVGVQRNAHTKIVYLPTLCNVTLRWPLGDPRLTICGAVRVVLWRVVPGKILRK